HAYYEVDATNLDLPRFNMALQRLIDRHDMLRAIVLADGTQQVLREVPRYEIGVLDLRDRCEPEKAQALDAIREEMSHQVMESDRWPLFDICASRRNGSLVRLHFSFDILIADVWSLQILFREWRELYNDPGAALPALELTFRDYITAEAGLRGSDLHARSREYWQDRISSIPPAADPPQATGARRITGPRFVRRNGGLEPGVWFRVKQIAARASLTPSSVLLSAFAEVLTLWSKAPRFTINVTLLNRLPLHKDVNEIVGDFTTLLPLAVDNSEPGTIADRAQRIQSQLMTDMEHRFVSGVEVMREVARSQGRAPGAEMPIVFTSLLSRRIKATAERTLWMGDVVYGITQTPQVWLDHQVMEEDGALVFNWDAVEERFPDGLLDDMFASYCSLIRELGEGAEDTWLLPANLLPPATQLDQRAAINSTEIAVPRVTLHGLFRDQADRQPQHQAVIARNGSLTYDELRCRANSLAELLRPMGARPNSLVAVVMEKGWEQIVAVMGVLQSGAAYLPIDPSVPRERLWRLLDHGEVAIALTQSRVGSLIDWPAGVRVIAVDTESFEPTGRNQIEDAQTPEDLAYVIYTSGSSGEPKGVMINHIGAVNTILDINRRFGVGPQDKVLAISNLGFDLSVYDVFGTLAAGGTIVMPDQCALRDPAKWAVLIQREGVTIWNSVPALMEMLTIHSCERAERAAESLRIVMLSGDWIPVTLPRKIKRIAPSAKLIGLGGATEASIWSILHPIEDDCSMLTSIPYGRPMANQRFHVLNEAMEPRPTWVPGELYISGMGLALGYWRNEERTVMSFVTHPVTGERMYRTGDLGRYLPDGSIEFLGRDDTQVKVRGHRIELGEIEAALAKHPAARSAAVMASGPRSNKRLSAYIAVDRPSRYSADDFKTFLSEKLPGYMVPSTYFILESLPLTDNGKVNRRALADLVPTSRAPSSPQASDPIERRIASCVASVLKVESVSSEANLLELGANSIDLITVAAILEKEIAFSPNLGQFYDEPTVKGLVRSYAKRKAENAPDSIAIKSRRFVAANGAREEGVL
ncbi:MAG TPA: amino acid adenylation domain-containing protein, partial [Blastocatellia bacterium]|nr:amino acid adenylation domain-containing protein [Blastocatellia bacterium]